MKLERTARQGDQEAQGRLGMRVIRESLVPQEKKERPVMKEMLAQMVPLERGAALVKEDLGGPLV